MKTINISELIESDEASIQTGPFGTQLKAKDYVASGTPVINVKNVGFGEIRHAGLEYVDDKMKEKLSAHILQKGDIVFGRKGAVERHAFIYEHGDGWIQGSDCLRLRINSSRINNRFVSYYFRTKAHQDWMQALCSFGATMASLNQGIVRRISLPLPSIQTQNKVAAILNSYDDLIEVNNRRIQLLENMAEEIYKEWFVRLRFPGFEVTEVVKGLPAGWQIQSLDDLGTYLNGYAFKPSDWKESGIPIIKIKEMTSGITSNTPRNDGGKINSKFLILNGDIVFSWSATLLVKIWSDGQGLLNQHLFKVTPNGGVSKEFLYHSINSSLAVFGMLATGATMKHIKRKELSFVKVNMPPPKIMNLFTKHVGSLSEECLLLTKANKNLTQARDKLLPRLISGKLSVENLDINFPPSMEEGLA